MTIVVFSVFLIVYMASVTLVWRKYRLGAVDKKTKAFRVLAAIVGMPAAWIVVNFTITTGMLQMH